MEPEPTGDRLRTAFAFLEDLGFRLTRVSDGGAFWDSGDREITVFCSYLDGSILEMSLRAAPRRASFSPRTALVVMGRGDRWPSHGWAVRDSGTFNKYVLELRNIVRDALADFLRGPDALWERAHRIAQAENDAYNARELTRCLRARAEAARMAGNWEEVVHVSHQLLDAGLPLTRAEEARLRLARRRLPPP